MMLPLNENDEEFARFGVNNKHIKAKKRQLERVRRQRINERLEKLKVIVMKQLGNDVGFYPPMEKADILELAIRCLEGKEEPASSSQDKENTTTERKPFERLENNTPSPKRKRRLETTPIRIKCFKTTQPKSDHDGNSPSPVIGEFRAEFKPLLQHPIRSFSVINEYDDVTYMDQSNRSPRKTDESLQKHTIWRPWTM